MSIWMYLVTFMAGILTGVGLTILLLGLYAMMVASKKADIQMESFFGPRDG